MTSCSQNDDDSSKPADLSVDYTIVLSPEVIIPAPSQDPLVICSLAQVLCLLSGPRVLIKTIRTIFEWRGNTAYSELEVGQPSSNKLSWVDTSTYKLYYDRTAAAELYTLTKRLEIINPFHIPIIDHLQDSCLKIRQFCKKYPFREDIFGTIIV